MKEKLTGNLGVELSPNHPWTNLGMVSAVKNMKITWRSLADLGTNGRFFCQDDQGIASMPRGTEGKKTFVKGVAKEFDPQWIQIRLK